MKQPPRYFFFISDHVIRVSIYYLKMSKHNDSLCNSFARSFDDTLAPYPSSRIKSI